MASGIPGAQLYTVRKFTQSLEDIADTLRKIADIGYTAIQISAFGGVDREDVARIIQDNALAVAATHMGWGSFLEDLDGVIETNRLWGCKHPAIGGLPREYYSRDGIRRFLEELGPVAEALAAEGMDFSYHNHNHELARYDCGKTWLETLYDEAPPEALKAEIDTYWIQAGGGDPAWWLRRCAGRIPVIHLKDMCITPDREIRMAEVGEGNLNWPAIIEAGEAGGTECYLVEQDDCYGRDPFESLAISLRNLKAMGVGA
jgi:sugar phosphate isomerase/epimerase